MSVLQRTIYIVACTIFYLTATVVLGLLVWFGWWMFVVYVLDGFGCDGACNAVGDFTGEHWWLIGGVTAGVIAVFLLPFYRRLIRER